MICGNEKCRRAVERPLELYDGSWACPHCRKPLSEAFTRFCVTAENEELFTLSERCYFASLTETDDAEESERLAERAMELCKQSALAGNPQAVARLGYYYDKGYLRENRSEAMRCGIACLYYGAVCFSEINELPVERGVRGTYDWHEIRVRAARRLLAMLARLPQRLRRSDRTRFDHNANLARAVRRLGDFGVAPLGAEESAPPSPEEAGDQAYFTLSACLSKTRAPLFGICRLDGRDLKRLFAIGDEKTNACRIVEQGTEVRLFACDAQDVVLPDPPRKLSNRRLIDELLAQLSPDEPCCLYFFNRCGAHPLLGGRAIEATASVLARANFDLVRRLANDGGRIDETFFDDDFYLYGGESRTADAVKTLIGKICGGNRT